MIPYGKAGTLVELRGEWVCCCSKHERIRLKKGDRFPGHFQGDLWRWYPLPKVVKTISEEVITEQLTSKLRK